MSLLVLEEIRPEGRVHLAELADGEVVLGRDAPPTGISIASKAISRHHGALLHVGGHWLYRDLGSTNGSWVNNVPVRSGRFRPVRPGDLLQLADTIIQLSSSSPVRSVSGRVRAMLVIRGEEFAGEFPIPEYGRALVVGGARADLPLEGDLAELPSLVVERRGDRVCAFSLAREAQALLNDSPLTETAALKDGDEIRIGEYTLLMNDPPGSGRVAGAPGGRGAADEWVDPPSGGEELTATARVKSTVRLPFGQGSGSAEGGDAAPADGEEQTGYEGHPSMRFSGEEGEDTPWAGLEDRIVLVVGFILLVALMFLVVWWVFL